MATATLNSGTMDRLSKAHTSHAAKSLGLDRDGMKAMSVADRLKHVHSKIEEKHDDSAPHAPAGAPPPVLQHTRETMKSLSHVDRVAAVMQQLESGASHAQLSKIHGTTSVGALAEDSLAFVKGAPPPSPNPGGNRVSAQRTVSVHAENALEMHTSRMTSLEHMLASVQMLREKPILTGKLQRMGIALAKAMSENPTAAGVLGADDAAVQLEQAFNSLMDADHSGKLTYKEFKSGLNAIGLDLGINLRDLFEAIDTDNDGTVDAMEFVAAISAAKEMGSEDTSEELQYSKPDLSLALEPGSARSASARSASAPVAAGETAPAPVGDNFSKYDTDCDGMLNRAELAACLDAEGFEVDENYVTDLMTRYGGSSAAGVAKETFPYMWQHLFCTDDDVNSELYGVRTVNIPIHDGGFGFELVEGLPATGAILVGNVQAGSEAAMAGVMEGDEAVAVGEEMLRNRSLEDARSFAQFEAAAVAEMEARREKAGGQYRCVKDAPIRTKPSMTAGITVDTLQANTDAEVRETTRDEHGVQWIHVARGWAPTVSEQGMELAIRTNGDDSSPLTVAWKFGPQHAPDHQHEVSERQELSDEQQIEELQKTLAECQSAVADPSLSEAARRTVITNMEDCRSKLRALGCTVDPADEPVADGSGEEDFTEERLREMFEEYDQDEQGNLDGKELLMLLQDHGKQTDAAYIYDCLKQFGDSDSVDFSGFLRIWKLCTEQAASAPVDTQTKFEQYARTQHGLLLKEDVFQMLVAEFGYANDHATDGVADGLLAKYGQYDADGVGSISLDEFGHMWNSFTDRATAPGLRPLSAEEAAEKFALYDDDKDDLLSTFEVKKMIMSECGCDDEFALDVIERFGEFDTNGDGCVDLQEFPSFWNFLIATVNGTMGEGQLATGDEVVCQINRTNEKLGFTVNDQQDEPATIFEVYTDDARAAGVDEYDVIVEVDGIPISDGAHAVEELVRAKDDISNGSPIQIVVQKHRSGAPPQGTPLEEAPPFHEPMTQRRPPPRSGGMFACLSPSRERARARQRNPPT